MSFATGGQSAAKLKVANPTSLKAVDVTGDGKPDLVIGTASGVSLFVAGGSGYADATEAWGLSGDKGEVLAAGDISGDGKIDLMLGNEIYMNDGHRFTPAGAKLAWPQGAQPMAAAFIAADGGKRDAWILFKDGQLLIFKNPGAAGKEWTAQSPRTIFKADDKPLAAAIGDFGDDGLPHVLLLRREGVTRYSVDSAGEAPADYARLCGQTLTNSSEALAKDLENAALVMIDINGDHRPDLLIANSAGSVLMVNRGFGTFLPLPNPAAPLQEGGSKRVQINSHLCWAAAETGGHGPENLVALTAEGTLLEATNSTPAPH